MGNDAEGRSLTSLTIPWVSHRVDGEKGEKQYLELKTNNWIWTQFSLGMLRIGKKNTNALVV